MALLEKNMHTSNPNKLINNITTNIARLMLSLHLRHFYLTWILFNYVCCCLLIYNNHNELMGLLLSLESKLNLIVVDIGPTTFTITVIVTVTNLVTLTI